MTPFLNFVFQFAYAMERNKFRSFKFAEENRRFLRIFEFSGFLPSREGNFEDFSSFVLIVFIILLIILQVFFCQDEEFSTALFYLEIATILIEILLTLRNVKLQNEFFNTLNEIDEKIINSLKMKDELTKLNVKIQRIISFIWISSIGSSLYFPISDIITKGLSLNVFMIPLFKFIVWALLTQMSKVKFLFFYSIMAVRLSAVSHCLEDMQKDKMTNDSIFVNEMSLVTVTRNVEQYSKLIALKQIYQRIWRLQGLLYELSGIFLLLYSFCYFAELAQVIFVTVKIVLNRGSYKENPFDLLLWLLIMNVFVIAFFVLSRLIVRFGLKISGLIHNIARDDDVRLTETVKMFSLQTMQQPMLPISILNIIDYDQTNMKAVKIIYSLWI